jgi:hypothetical protein
MVRSHVIEIDGMFVAGAVELAGLVRIIAVDPRVEPLDHSTWPTVKAARAAVVRRLRPTSR